MLLNLPTVGSKVVSRKAPASYTKIVIKGMTRAEMTLKVVMSPSEPVSAFVEQFNKLLADADANEFARILDMKGLRKVDQSAYLDCFHNLQPDNSMTMAKTMVAAGNEDEDESRIKKLEKMIRKRL